MRRPRISSFLAVASALVLLSCTDDRHRSPEESPSLSAGVERTPPLPDRFATIGHPPTPAEIAEWNIDASSDGTGLPPGHGTYGRGAALFATRCASCHGARGEGIPPFPKLVGREPRDGFPFGRDAKYAKTIGNYWPYATTLYDYINRAMPFNAPGSLPPDDVYSVVAFLLAENGIVSREATIDAKSLPRVRMPARDRFVADNRTGGPVIR